MKKMMMSILVLSVFCINFALAADSAMKEHDKASSNKIGDLIHESVVDGYMLSYYFMDLRDQKNDTQSMEKQKNTKDQEMKKPHHIMVYIMDENHNPVLKGKVGFLIKNAEGEAQNAMGMLMGDGFGNTTDMKKKGVYTITTKALIGDKTLMDKFEYEMK